MEASLTNQEYAEVISECRKLYEAKLKDYGTAWHVLRPSSLTDQIYIKVNRIRNIQIHCNQKIEEDIRGEFIGVINYSIIALIQLEIGFEEVPISTDIALEKYDKYAGQAFDLMSNKNHDYGEAWRNMRISSLVDIILMKILRVKQIEDLHGKTVVSEGLDANYFDMLNYAVFSLIKLNEAESIPRV
ncbi:MAG: DUF1599 domain-containing protein [Bacteroidales bacterium]